MSETDVSAKERKELEALRLREREGLNIVEKKELETLRAEKAVRERAEAGYHTGEVNCGTLGCDFGRQPAELRKEVIQTENKDLGIVENEFVRWIPVGDEYCPECEMPLTVIEPNAQSVFPKNYRWVYPKPVA